MMTHEFAIFYKNFSELNQFISTDKDFIHRIIHVLRMKSGDTFIIFNQQYHGFLTLQDLTTKKVTGKLKNFQKNIIHVPHITLFLPVLKKEALSEAVYGAVECGVSAIQLVMTEKIQRSWQGKNELERLERVVIAAAEQAKCFSFPDIKEPISLSAAISSLKSEHILCADPEGISLKELSINGSCALFLGPEGGLTEKERNDLQVTNAIFFKLTPTILRARQAAVLSIGFLRSL
ncbi:RsmE family RNA methyltransferase [Candidatus Babeliales bacterium]|nr:RsmE family RNA methyltransferase [Candidatus Babeliales bacterium]